MSTDYAAFLEAKAQLDGAVGAEPVWMPDFLFPFQRTMTEWAIRQGRAALFADCGLGKAQPVDEPILTPTGWQSMGSLEVGSEVISVDGLPARVLGVYPQGIRPIYRVQFSDGAEVRCDEEHLWAVRSDNHHQRGQDWKILRTADLAEAPIRYDRKDDWGTFSWRVPMCTPIEFGGNMPLPIDPYVLGVLLGDGCLTQPGVTFTVGDPAIADRVSLRLPVDLRVVRVTDYSARTPSFRISLIANGYGRRNPVLDALRDMGLMSQYSYEKHIPAAYLTASSEQRLELLRGLLDTDGEANISHVQFCSTSPRLAEGVGELARSLGGTSRLTTKQPHYTYGGEKRAGRLAYKVQVRLPGTLQPFALSRKVDKYSSRPCLEPVRKIVAVERDGEGECVCIAVDHPSHLYITHDYVVTHNTPCQLVWAENVRRITGRPVLIMTPLAVAYQTVMEAEKFGIEAAISRDGEATSGITVTNYDKLHLFDRHDFAGVVCDESSAIKAFDGVRRAEVTDFQRKMRFRLLCTATAAPNDYVELGTSSEALGYLGHMDMLGRFFTNRDKTSKSMGGKWRSKAGDEWRFKGHAEQAFWRWVASWARAMRKPSDLGFSDEGFALPSLEYRQHVVTARTRAEGMLFDLPANGLQEEREEQRRTIEERCEMVAELLVDASPGVAWCHLNAEGDLLTKLIDGAVQVSGGDSPDEKEDKLAAFGRGEIRVLVTKPLIAGWGLNWQHCRRMTYFPSHSYELWYQAVRRLWRFGQTRPVIVDVVTTEGGANALKNMERKATQADKMFDSLVLHMQDALSIRRRESYDKPVELPSWL